MDAAPPAPPTSPRVVCVIVNWQGWRDTIPCVESLLAQHHRPEEILVVDSASADDSVARIRAAFSSTGVPSVEVLCAPANRGFAAASNIGIRAGLARGADFVWLLNNDIVAPPDTLTKLLHAAAAAHAGITGSVLRYTHNPQQIQAWGGGSVTPTMGYTRHFDRPVALGRHTFLPFASVLLRREMLQQIGPLDDGYFMYFEDSDLCFRARAAGWNLAIAADTAVLHREGGSSSSKKHPRIDRIVTASGLRFLGRYGRPRALSQCLFVLSRLGKRALRGNLAGMRAVLRGVRDFRRNEPLAFQNDSLPLPTAPLASPEEP